MTDEDMKQYLPLWREALAQANEADDCPITAGKCRNGEYDHNFKPPNHAYQVIKLMVEGWKPETKEDVAREMLARAFEAWNDKASANYLREKTGKYIAFGQSCVAYLVRCLPDGIKIADLPEVE